MLYTLILFELQLITFLVAITIFIKRSATHLTLLYASIRAPADVRAPAGVAISIQTTESVAGTTVFSKIDSYPGRFKSSFSYF